MGGRLKKFVDEWVGKIQDPFVLGMVQGQLLQFSCKPPLVKPTYKCKVKIPKTQKGLMAMEINSILSEGMIEVGQRNKRFFIHPFMIPKKNEESHFIINLRILQLLQGLKFVLSLEKCQLEPTQRFTDLGL